MKEVVIVSGARTSIGAFGGSLKDVSAIEMGSLVMREVFRRITLLKGFIEMQGLLKSMKGHQKYRDLLLLLMFFRSLKADYSFLQTQS